LQMIMTPESWSWQQLSLLKFRFYNLLLSEVK
jgi:hypothetical protein